MELKKIEKAILFSSFYIFIFTVLPSLSLWILPPEIQGTIPLIKEYTGIDIRSFIFVMLIVGVILAALSFLKNTASEGSNAYLVAGLTIEMIGFFLASFLLGLGNPLSMGVTIINLNYSSGGTLILDLQLAAILSISILLMSSLKTVMNFLYARKENKNEVL